ncbi:iron-containing alcohol dehydrogenase, partial [Haloferax profundi]|uniref:iron-containing alcohol dehydrogenase n=1 Tax=Haloferax profundi TaxID=1544718 RepID=UPI000AD608A8
MFDKSTWIKLPRNVLVGHGVLDQLADAVAELYLSGDPLLVTSPSPERIAGDRIREQFDGIESVSLDRASFESVERVVEIGREMGAGYLIALGGGKPIDVAKMASDRLECGFVSVPTAASHDGIVSGRSSIPEGDTRHSVAAD